MHDLDHVKLEVEADGELFFELQDPAVDGEFESEPEYEPNGAGELEAVEEMELASELLGVGSEQELDLFLGKLFRGAKKALGSPAGRVLGGLLRNVAKKALPIAGTAVGGFFGGPLGAGLGNRLASQAGSMFGLELEGLSPQDQEYEVAKSFVRLARSAAEGLGGVAGQAVTDPVGAARNALVSAAQAHAPGLLQAAGGAVQGLSGAPTHGGQQSGRWVRRGNRIILYGV